MAAYCTFLGRFLGNRLETGFSLLRQTSSPCLLKGSVAGKKKDGDAVGVIGNKARTQRKAFLECVRTRAGGSRQRISNRFFVANASRQLQTAIMVGPSHRFEPWKTIEKRSKITCSAKQGTNRKEPIPVFPLSALAGSGAARHCDPTGAKGAGTARGGKTVPRGRERISPAMQRSAHKPIDKREFASVSRLN